MRHAIERLVLGAVLLLALVLAPACSPPEATSDDGPAELSGIWQPSGGEPAMVLSGATLSYLELGGATGVSGLGTIFARAAADVPVCAELVYAASGDDAVAVYAEDVFARGSATQLFLYERVSADVLALTDEDGNRQTFARVASVPTEDACVTVGTTRRVEGLEVDLRFGNLLSDGTDLRIVDDASAVYRIDLAAEALVLQGDLGLTAYDQAVTMQGATFWAHCGCGGSQDVQRLQLGGAQVDAIDTATDLGLEISVRAAAWDGSVLWLAGYSYDSASQLLLEVDSDPEPDVLLASVELGVAPQAMTAMDGDLWTLVDIFGPRLVRIDPASGSVVEVVELPEPGEEGRYTGLAALGGELYLLFQTSGSSLVAVERVEL